MGNHTPVSLVRAALPLAAVPLFGAFTLPIFAASGQNRSGSEPARTHKQAAPPRPGQPLPDLPKPSVAPDPRRPQRLAPTEYMPVSEVRGGMRGYGLSVFQGSKIERFDVAVLGVMRKVNNGRDLILVRLGGPKLSRVTDVIAGMSGSPVYVNGRLLGAVAYGSQFTRESMGYVTPIEDMLEAWDPALPRSPGFGPDKGDTKPAPIAPAPVTLAQPVTLDGKTYRRVAIALPGHKAEPGTLALRRLGTRVTVSGVGGARFAAVAAELGKWGLEVRQGGGAAALPGLKASPLTPGGAIAMSLATGDIDITGIGTLTYRRGKQIVAFGHPFLGVGPIDAPMSTAYIHDIEPSFAESHKIGSPVSLVGAFSQDRPFSIGGIVGAKPTMVPVIVRVTDRSINRDREFQARIVRHPQLTTVLAAMAAGTAIAEVHGQPGDAMATVTTEVVADEVGTIRRTNRVYDAAAIDEAAISDLRSLLGLLSGNPFYPVGVRSVKMHVTIEAGRKTAQIERVFLKQGRFEPGDTVDVGVVLKPFKREREIKTLQIRIPPSVPSGVLLLSVGGGAGFGGGGGIRIGGITLLGGGSEPSGPSPANVEQAVKRFEERDRNDEVVARLVLPNAAININGEKLSDLPPHIEGAIRASGSRASGVRLERDEVRVAATTDYVVSGAQTIPIRVVRPGDAARQNSLLGGGILGAPTAPGGGTGSLLPPGSSPSANPVSPQSSPWNEEDDDNGPDSTPRVQTPRAAAPPNTPIPAAPPSGGSTTITPALGQKETGGEDELALRPVGAFPIGGLPAANTLKAVGRQPGIWRQATAADFRAGKLNGVTVTGTGEVRLAPKLTRVAESVEPYFWCLASDGQGSVFAGSGDTGIVYRVGEDGKTVPFARTGELEVHALVRAGDGTLYAGTSPNGRVFKIDPDGKVTKIADFDEKYVFALALNGTDLYAGVGGPRGRVYRIPVGNGTTASGNPEVVYDSTEGSVTTLAIGPQGGEAAPALYAGTAPNGLVVRIAGPNRSTVVFDAAEASISGLAVDISGTVFAACAPRGVLYRIRANETPRVLYEKTPTGSLNGVALGEDGILYTASGQTVIAVEPNGSSDSVRTFDAPSDIQILSLLPDRGGLWASTGSVGGVYRLEKGLVGKTGELVSAVFDAKTTARWGALRWTGSKINMTLRTRTGETSEPDGTWSDWSRPYTQMTGETIVSPPGRYLQYKMTFTGSDYDATEPVLRSVEAFYLTPNQTPQVALLSPRGGEVWKGTKTVRWSGTDPDRDVLAFELSVSGDGGKTWQKLPNATVATPPTKPAPVPGTTRAQNPPPAPIFVAAAAPEKQQMEQQMLGGIERELDKHPELSPEMRARILADAPQQLRDAVNVPPTGASVGGGFGNPLDTRETSQTFDTTRLPDGVYRLRVTASDKPANPDGELSAERISPEFRIVNRSPLLTVGDRDVTINPDKTAKIEGIAMHPSAAVRAVQFRVDGGDWTAGIARDGIFDSTLETFTLTTAALTPGSHTVEVQALDEAGNTATRRVTVTVR